MGDVRNHGRNAPFSGEGTWTQAGTRLCSDTGVSEIIRAHWDSRAEVFDDVDDHGLTSETQRRAWRELLSPFAGVPPVRALDVGCGTGFLAIILASLGHSVTAVDFAPQMVERARQKALRERLDIDFRVGDAVALDTADETFDLVAARHVLWNLPEPERGVGEWLRVLKPGGRLALIEGQWAESTSDRSWRRFRAPVVAAVVNMIAALASRAGRRYPRRILDRQYRRIEASLPFFGGPSASRLSTFLEANGVEYVQMRSLIDPALWGEGPRYPRYLAVGTRTQEAL
jgi:ubiquinone/menaquinone biosynthesis C-methylase UbiE